MRQIEVAQLEYSEDGRTMWIHNSQGCTVLRIQCTGKIVEHDGCINICAHADINVQGDIQICIPGKRPGIRKKKASVRS